MNTKRLILLLAVTLPATAMRMPTILQRAKRTERSTPTLAPTDQTTTRICFVGATEMKSKPISRVDTEHIQEFFDKHRDCFLTSNGVVEKKPGGLMQMEKTVGFPGLRVSSQTLILVEPRSCDGFTFELIDCGLSATGAPPLVWLFKQLTGDDKLVSATSLTSLYIHHNSPGEAVFCSNSQIEIQINVPEVLVKRLGSTRLGALEEQGSNALQQFLDREFVAAHERLHAAYLDFGRE